MTRILAVATVAVLCAGRAQAQTAAIEPGRFEIGVGPVWIGGASFGDRAAAETTPTGAARNLFSTSTLLDSVIGVEARFGARLTRRLDVEAIGSYAGPHLVATVTADTEATGQTFTAEEWVQQFAVGGAVVWRFSARRRWTPFATGGAAYMRQLHEQQTLLATGGMYEAGAGVKYMIGSRTRARLKTIGVRAEAKAVVRTAGVNTDGRAHVSPAMAASLYVRF